VDVQAGRQGTLLGPWRSIELPPTSVLEQARRYRGEEIQYEEMGVFSFPLPTLRSYSSLAGDSAHSGVEHDRF
jgi:hypothetical protein